MLSDMADGSGGGSDYPTDPDVDDYDESSGSGHSGKLECLLGFVR